MTPTISQPSGRRFLVCVPESHLNALNDRHTMPRIPAADEIVYTVAIIVGVDCSQMLGGASYRTKSLNQARVIAALLIRRWLGMSYPEIARFLGSNSHGAAYDRVSRAALALHHNETWIIEAIKRVAIRLLGPMGEPAFELACAAAAYTVDLSGCTVTKHGAIAISPPSPTPTGAHA